MSPEVELSIEKFTPLGEWASEQILNVTSAQIDYTAVKFQ